MDSGGSRNVQLPRTRAMGSRGGGRLSSTGIKPGVHFGLACSLCLSLDAVGSEEIYLLLEDLSEHRSEPLFCQPLLRAGTRCCCSSLGWGAICTAGVFRAFIVDKGRGFLLLAVCDKKEESLSL